MDSDVFSAYPDMNPRCKQAWRSFQRQERGDLDEDLSAWDKSIFYHLQILPVNNFQMCLGDYGNADLEFLLHQARLEKQQTNETKNPLRRVTSLAVNLQNIQNFDETKMQILIAFIEASGIQLVIIRYGHRSSVQVLQHLITRLGSSVPHLSVSWSGDPTILPTFDFNSRTTHLKMSGHFPSSNQLQDWCSTALPKNLTHLKLVGHGRGFNQNSMNAIWSGLTSSSMPSLERFDLQSIRCSDEDCIFNGLSMFLSKHVRLQDLVLKGSPFYYEDLSLLSSDARIQRIRRKMQPLADSISSHPSLQKIKLALRLPLLEPQRTIFLLHSALQSRSLRFIEIDRLVQVHREPSMRTAKLQPCFGCDEAGLKAFFRQWFSPEITHFSLNGFWRVEEVPDSEDLREVPAFLWGSYQSCQVRDFEMKACFFELEFLSNLCQGFQRAEEGLIQRLVFIGCPQLGEDSIAPRILSSLSRQDCLRHFTLQDCFSSPSILPLIGTFLESHPSLENLNLSRNKFLFSSTSEPFETIQHHFHGFLGSLEKHPSLKILDLSENDDNGSMSHLITSLKGNSVLETLDLSGSMSKETLSVVNLEGLQVKNFILLRQRVPEPACEPKMLFSALRENCTITTIHHPERKDRSDFLQDPGISMILERNRLISQARQLDIKPEYNIPRSLWPRILFHFAALELDLSALYCALKSTAFGELLPVHAKRRL